MLSVTNDTYLFQIYQRFGGCLTAVIVRHLLYVIVTAMVHLYMKFSFLT